MWFNLKQILYNKHKIKLSHRNLYRRTVLTSSCLVSSGPDRGAPPVRSSFSPASGPGESYQGLHRPLLWPLLWPCCRGERGGLTGGLSGARPWKCPSRRLWAGPWSWQWDRKETASWTQREYPSPEVLRAGAPLGPPLMGRAGAPLGPLLCQAVR